jgi:hypothetical protein
MVQNKKKNTKVVKDFAEVRKTASFFECFPYVCPEPVLAK